MLVKIGNAVVNSDDVIAVVRDDGNNEFLTVGFRDGALLKVRTLDAEADLIKLERLTAP